MNIFILVFCVKNTMSFSEIRGNQVGGLLDDLVISHEKV